MDNAGSRSEPDLAPQSHTVAVTLTHLWGIYGIGDVPVELSWSPERDTLTIRRTRDGKILLSTDFTSVTRADFAFNLLTLTVGGQKFRLVFGPQPHLFMANGQVHTDGGLTMLLGSLQAKRSGMDGLRRELRHSGAKTTKPPLLKLIVWTTVGFVITLVLVVAILGVWASKYSAR